jgi:hypothetical protein
MWDKGYSKVDSIYSTFNFRCHLNLYKAVYIILKNKHTEDNKVDKNLKSINGINNTKSVQTINSNAKF